MQMLLLEQMFSSSVTTGEISLALNYTSKEYSITKVDNTPEFITAADNTTINASGIQLLDWKDIRLNKALNDPNHSYPSVTQREILYTTS